MLPTATRVPASAHMQGRAIVPYLKKEPTEAGPSLSQSSDGSFRLCRWLWVPRAFDFTREAPIVETSEKEERLLPSGCNTDVGPHRHCKSGEL